MGEKDKDREREYSPNPDYVRSAPREHPDAERSRLYQYHRAAGTMELYFEMYPLDRPPSRDRDAGNER